MSLPAMIGVSRIRDAFVRLVPILCALFFVAWALLYISPNHSFDDADPEVLNQAWRLASGKPIYTPIGDAPYVHNAYTPLYYLLVGAGLHFTGLSYLPAEALSLLASLAAFGVFAMVGWRSRASWKEGAWTGCLFLLVPAVLYNSVRTHPQMLAVAFVLWSFYFASRKGFVSVVLISPLFSALAIYTKHSVSVLPIAVALWLLFRKRQWFPIYLAVLIAALGVPFLWLERETAGNFWLNAVTFNQIGYSVLQIPLILIHHAGPLFLFIGLACITVWRRLRKGEWDLVDFYFVAVVFSTVVTCGRTGAHTQYVIELCAVALLLLLTVTGTRSMIGRDRLVSWQLLFLLAYAPLYIALENGPFALASRRASASILPLIEHSRGPIISEQGSFALFGSGQIYIQLGHFVNLSRVGLWDRQKIVHDITDRRAEWVITLFDITSGQLSEDDQERFTPDMVQALQRNYRIAKIVQPYYLYRPLPATAD